jgi:hypothetical protein
MKNLSITVLTICLALISLSGKAQLQAKSLPLNEPNYNRPKLFVDLPDSLSFNPSDFSNLFEAKAGERVNIPIATGAGFSGQVISKSEKPKSTSIVIGLINRPGARLIFTKVTDENNLIKYLGRIISLKHGDSYEIVEENNKYYFKKKGIYDLMNE